MAQQFIIVDGARAGHTPHGWLSEQLDCWLLVRHPTLPAIRLVTTTNHAVGWILGYPINRGGVLLGDGEELLLPSKVLCSVEDLEDFIYSFAGRFVVALLSGHAPRVYLDPCGSLSAVYSAHQRRIASTPSLIPYDERTPDRTELTRALGIPHRNAMFPFDMTPRVLVERILPNHFLDLLEWRTMRHWPKAPLAERPVEDVIEVVANTTKRNIAAIVSSVPTYLMLTAGKDSRMLLACSMEVAHRLELVTGDLGDDGASVDCATAKQIAKHFNLNHRVLRRKPATEADLQVWTYRIGNGTGEVRGRSSVTSYRDLPGGHAMLYANANELAWNTFPWLATTSGTPSAEQLLRACGCPPLEEPLRRANAWLQSLPVRHPLQVGPFWYLEQRLGGWAGVFAYGLCDGGFYIMPICDRRAVEAMLSLPADYHLSGLLMRDIIDREWPELLQWPFNKTSGIRGMPIAIQRQLRSLRGSVRRVSSRLRRRVLLRQ